MNVFASRLMDRLGRLASMSLASRRAVEVSRSVAPVLVAALLWAGLDWKYVLPPEARWAATLVLWGALCWSIIRVGRTLRIARNPKAAALEIEAPAGGHSVLLSTAAEYASDRTKAATVTGQDVVPRLMQGAEKYLDGQRPPFGWRIACALVIWGAVLAAWSAFLILVPQAEISLRRLIPWSGSSYTTVVLLVDRPRVPKGDAYEISCQVTGRHAERVEVMLKGSSEPHAARLPMTPLGNGIHVFEIPAVKENFEFQVTANDGRSPRCRVTAYEAPRVEDFVALVTPPAYTEQKPYEVAVRDFRFLRGSRVEFRVRSTLDLGTASLALQEFVPKSRETPPEEDGGVDVTAGKRKPRKPDLEVREFPMRGGGKGPWTLERDFPFPADFYYWLTLIASDKEVGGDKTASWIKVVADAAPKIEITEPGRDQTADPADKVSVKLLFSDDFAVRKMRLCYGKLGQDPTLVDVVRWEKQGRRFTAQANIDLAPLKLKPYEVVYYYAEGEDNNTLDGPGIGRSKTFFIEITNEKAGTCRPGSSNSIPAARLNLIEIQKNLISTTNQLLEEEVTGRADDLAASQRTIRDYADAYRDAMALAKVPPEAMAEMDKAIMEMDESRRLLLGQDLAGSLPHQQEALQALYNVLAKSPKTRVALTGSLQLPGNPEDAPGLVILLDAIRKTDDQKRKELKKDVDEILQEAQELKVLNEELLKKRHPEKGGLSARRTREKNPEKQPQQKPSPRDSRKQPQDKSGNAGNSGSDGASDGRFSGNQNNSAQGDSTRRPGQDKRIPEAGPQPENREAGQDNGSVRSGEENRMADGKETGDASPADSRRKSGDGQEAGNKSTPGNQAGSGLQPGQSELRKGSNGERSDGEDGMQNRSGNGDGRRSETGSKAGGGQKPGKGSSMEEQALQDGTAGKEGTKQGLNGQQTTPSGKGQENAASLGEGREAKSGNGQNESVMQPGDLNPSVQGEVNAGQEKGGGSRQSRASQGGKEPGRAGGAGDSGQERVLGLIKDESLLSGRHSGKGRKNGSGEDGASSSPNSDVDAEEETRREMAKRAASLARKMKDLAERDGRVSGRLGRELESTISRMVMSREEGDGGIAVDAESAPNYDLRPVLEQIITQMGALQERLEPTEMRAEEYPAEFQPFVEDYFKKLTREE